MIMNYKRHEYVIYTKHLRNNVGINFTIDILNDILDSLLFSAFAFKRK